MTPGKLTQGEGIDTKTNAQLPVCQSMTYARKATISPDTGESAGGTAINNDSATQVGRWR